MGAVRVAGATCPCLPWPVLLFPCLGAHTRKPHGEGAALSSFRAGSFAAAAVGRAARLSLPPWSCWVLPILVSSSLACPALAYLSSSSSSSPSLSLSLSSRRPHHSPARFPPLPSSHLTVVSGHSLRGGTFPAETLSAVVSIRRVAARVSRCVQSRIPNRCPNRPEKSLRGSWSHWGSSSHPTFRHPSTVICFPKKSRSLASLLSFIPRPDHPTLVASPLSPPMMARNRSRCCFYLAPVWSRIA